MKKKQMNIYLIVITTFEDNFLQINEMRREQCKALSIPVLFVFNGKVPEGYRFRDDELYINIPNIEGMNPVMFLKFTTAVKEHVRIQGKEPDFYVRCTATCFIDFVKLQKVLHILPRTNCVAGPYDSKYDDRVFCNGTCMIVTPDVAKKLTEENIAGNIMTFIENDDVTISWLGQKYGILFDLTYWFSYLEGLSMLPEPIEEFKSWKAIVRIKNLADRKTIDVGIWRQLHKRIYGL